MPSRRVLIAFHEPVLGGATLSVLRVIPRLEQRGWSFSFWAPRPSDLYDQLAARGHEVAGAPRFIQYSGRALRLPPGPRRRLASVPSYVRAYRAFLRKAGPQLVHANSIICIAEALIAKRDGYPVLLHVHEMLPTGLRGRLMRQAAWRRLDAVVAVSAASAAAMSLGTRTPRIVYEAASVPDEPAVIRDSPLPFTVGTVAVVSTRKGSDLFVDAAEMLLARKDARYSFEMVGAPNDAVERDWATGLLGRALASGIAHRDRADVAECLRRWDLFVLPSRADPFPISMLEAMASGLPVVGTAVDGLTEQVTDSCGLLVPADDPAALAGAIERMRASPRRQRAAMGAAGRERVASRFSLDHQAEALDDAYRAALSWAPRRR